MCGRFAVTIDPALLATQIDAINEIPAAVDPGENYNVAPTDGVATVVCRHLEPGDEPTRRLRWMRWGLLPPWTKAGRDGRPAAGGPLLINARADKVTASPAYRGSVDRRRCLVPMNGYYEWRASGGESKLPYGAPGVRGKARKTPFYIHGEGAMLFAAGLWTVWRPYQGADPVLSATIITTDAVGKLADIHGRMPLLLPEGQWNRWLDPDASIDTRQLAREPDVAGIALHEVSTLVNNVRNNSAQLIEPVAPQSEQGYLL